VNQPDQPEARIPNTEPTLRWVFLVLIGLATIVGVITGEAFDISYEDTVRTIVPVLMFFVGISGFLLARLIVLPQMARKPDVLPQTLASAGYAFAEAPATYGVVAAIIAGHGWVALPFGALALIFWSNVRSFVAARFSTANEEFPRL
jgi:hypothetical protein